MAFRLTRAVLGPYTWTRGLISSYFDTVEKDVFIKQIEELKTQLQREREHSACQDQRVDELSTSLKSETKDNQSLWDQVELLTNELHEEKELIKQLKDLSQKEKTKGYEQCTLRIKLSQQLEEMQRQLAQQKMREELLVDKEKETQTELEKLTVSYGELHQAYCDISHVHNEIQRRYNRDMKAQQLENVTLQQKIKTVKSYVTRGSSQVELVRGMKQELDAFHQNMEQETKLLQEASERERSLHMELEDLKIQLNEQISKNVKLVAELKEEEKASLILRIETVQLMEEPMDQVCQQEEETPAVSQDPALVEEETPAVSEDPALVEEAAVCEEKAVEKGKTPFRKRFGHFFGLRKKKKDKQQESTSNSGP